MTSASPTERISALSASAEGEIAAAATVAELEELRIKYLGRKAELNELLRSIPQLDPAERGAVGKTGNETKRSIEMLLDQRVSGLKSAELNASLSGESIDVTLPGDPPMNGGSLHLITQVRREIEDVFVGLGFMVADGPEVEQVYYNFDALNHLPNHPARDWTDTFYFTDDRLLRTHTSPVQIHIMQQQPPPVYVIIPGKVYRRDSDATHTPMFHQVEGLAVDDGITLADLRGTLLEFARAIFGDTREIRLRPHFFPFTEPSVEVDVSCFKCEGSGFVKDGSRCSLCKGIGWIEVLGAGMVDPNVFGHVEEHGYDPQTVQGFAFGMGVERIAMLRHGVPDLRLFYDNDVRFLRQFA